MPGDTRMTDAGQRAIELLRSLNDPKSPEHWGKRHLNKRMMCFGCTEWCHPGKYLCQCCEIRAFVEGLDG